MRTFRRLIAVAALVSLVPTACGGDADEDATESTSPAGDEADDGGGGLSGSDDDEIVIQGSAFKVKGPVKANTSVGITNKDPITHTVTMDAPNGFNVRVSGGEGEVFMAVQPPGRYPFHCEIHPSMKGVIVIE